MIQIEHTEVYGFEAAIRGMRNPMNSWYKSDSSKRFAMDYHVGPNDLELMVKLVKAGSDHSKFMRMIDVTCDVTAPLYWWKEYDTYKVSTVANSCSTMHKIQSKPIEVSDFSVDDFYMDNSDGYGMYFADVFASEVATCEALRLKYIETGDKRYWRGLIQLLPSSYNQRRTLHLNYAVLRNIYHARRHHKLNEWRHFCCWIETLPYAKELICCD